MSSAASRSFFLVTELAVVCEFSFEVLWITLTLQVMCCLCTLVPSPISQRTHTPKALRQTEKHAQCKNQIHALAQASPSPSRLSPRSNCHPGSDFLLRSCPRRESSSKTNGKVELNCWGLKRLFRRYRLLRSIGRYHSSIGKGETERENTAMRRWSLKSIENHCAQPALHKWSKLNATIRQNWLKYPS